MRGSPSGHHPPTPKRAITSPMSVAPKPPLLLTSDTLNGLRRVALWRGHVLERLIVERADTPNLVGATLRGRVARVLPRSGGTYVDIGLEVPVRIEGAVAAALAPGAEALVDITGPARQGKAWSGRLALDTSAEEHPAPTPWQRMLEELATTPVPGAGPDLRIVMDSRRDAEVCEDFLAQRTPPVVIASEAKRSISQTFDLEERTGVDDGREDHPGLPRPLPDASPRQKPGSRGVLHPPLTVTPAKAGVPRKSRHRPAQLLEVPAFAGTTGEDGATGFPLPLRERERVRVRGIQAPREPVHLELDDILAALHETRVELPGGGEIVIEETEALVAVDVNAGEASDTPLLLLNQRAVREALRQVRLRALAGIIVIDVLRLRHPKDRAALLEAATREAAADPWGLRVLGLTRSGLLELSRPRRGWSVREIVA